MPAGSRQVASSDSSPIEEISSQTGIAFDNSLIFRDENANFKRQEERPRNRELVDYPGSSETFATIFEEVNNGGGSESANNSRRSGFAGLLARAINVYEATAKTIHGQEDVRGASVSLTL
jgi:hypothetical protein